MKLCKGCGCIKPMGEFYAHSEMSDGHLNYCKECIKSRLRNRRVHSGDVVRRLDREKYLRNREVVLARNRRWAANNQDVVAAHRLTWSARNPDKRRAHKILRRAVLSGKVQKQPCQVCGELEVEGHHPDYSKPLEVIWLCVYHHCELRRQQRESAA